MSTVARSKLDGVRGIAAVSVVIYHSLISVFTASAALGPASRGGAAGRGMVTPAE